MGATFVSYPVTSKTASRVTSNEIRSAFNDKREQDEYDYGHAGYTGSFAEFPGVTVTNESFETRDQAEEWLQDNTEKWDNAKSVYVGLDAIMGGWASE